MAKKKAPKKHLGSYLLPFFLILVLLGSGFYIVQNKLNFDDLKRVLKGPELTKNDKIELVYQEGDNQIKHWNKEDWDYVDGDSFLQVGDSIKTSNSGVMVLRFFDDTELRLSGSTTIELIRLDKDANDGDHLAVELVSGKLWRRGPEGNTSEADFIINTNHQVIQMNKASVVDINTNPESVKVISSLSSDHPE